MRSYKNVGRVGTELELKPTGKVQGWELNARAAQCLSHGDGGLATGPGQYSVAFVSWELSDWGTDNRAKLRVSNEDHMLVFDRNHMLLLLRTDVHRKNKTCWFCSSWIPAPEEAPFLKGRRV